VIAPSELKMYVELWVDVRPARVLAPDIVTRWPPATGTTAVILSIVVPVSPAAVMAYFQVLPTATGKGTDAPEPPEEAGLDGVAPADAEAAEVVAGAAAMAPVLGALGEPDELAMEQPASARPASSRQPAEVNRCAVDVSMLMWLRSLGQGRFP
jgi:hypothetical protein